MQPFAFPLSCRTYHLRTIACLALFLSTFVGASMTQADSIALYIATQSTPLQTGIALGHLDLASGELKNVALVAQTPDPSFIALDSKRHHLYICNSQTPGGVS